MTIQNPKLSRKEASDIVWSMLYPDEEWVFGGSAGEAFSTGIDIMYSVLIDGVRTKEEYDPKRFAR